MKAGTENVKESDAGFREQTDVCYLTASLSG